MPQYANTCSPCTFKDTPFLGNQCNPMFALFMSIIEQLITSQAGISEPCIRAGSLHDVLGSNREAFDFIIVGAGPGGSLLARRLSENPSWRVLLIEAGPEEPTIATIPAFAVTPIATTMDWGFTTEPQKNACLSKGGFCYWPRGKMISGTSVMSGMMYTRGNPKIYDHWESLGNDGWSYQDVLPYFKKSERCTYPNADDGYHGTDGIVPVNRFNHQPEFSWKIVQAAKEIGYPETDPNGRSQRGASVASMMTSDGMKATPGRVILRPVASRRNLVVLTNSFVTRILVNQNNNTIVNGIEYIDARNKKRTAYARKEVILSAGAIGSPQTLLLSGIGPEEDLQQLGLPVMKDLPGVGKNLHNHVSVSIGFFLDEPSTNDLTLEAVDLFLKNRTGPLSSTGLSQNTVFMTTKYANEVPDIQTFFTGFSASCSMTGQNNECSSGVVNGECKKRRITVRPTVVLPQSRGQLTLKSTNPQTQPSLDPNYFDKEEDLLTLVEGAKLAVKLMETETMKKLGAIIDSTVIRGCEQHRFLTDEYWKCHIKQKTSPENHQAGTCKMGPASDEEAVVGHNLKVHGFSNLRVVDASVFPFLPNSNPIATIYMMAEKVADFIRQDWVRLIGKI